MDPNTFSEPVDQTSATAAMSAAAVDSDAHRPQDKSSRSPHGGAEKPALSGIYEPATNQNPPTDPNKLPKDIEDLIRGTFDAHDTDWSTLQFYIAAALEEMQPVVIVEYLDTVNFAHLLRQRFELIAHQGRLQRLQRALAVRDVLRPGYAKAVLEGAHLRPRDQDKAHPLDNGVIINERFISLDEQGNGEDEALLEKRALEILQQQGSGPKALETLAYRLALPELNDVAKQLALVEARLDIHREMASRRRLNRNSVK